MAVPSVKVPVFLILSAPRSGAVEGRSLSIQRSPETAP